MTPSSGTPQLVSVWSWHWQCSCKGPLGSYLWCWAPWGLGARLAPQRYRAGTSASSLCCTAAAGEEVLFLQQNPSDPLLLLNTSQAVSLPQPPSTSWQQDSSCRAECWWQQSWCHAGFSRDSAPGTPDGAGAVAVGALLWHHAMGCRPMEPATTQPHPHLAAALAGQPHWAPVMVLPAHINSSSLAGCTEGAEISADRLWACRIGLERPTSGHRRN